MLGREDVGVGIFVAWGRAEGTITPDAMSPMLGWAELSWEGDISSDAP